MEFNSGFKGLIKFLPVGDKLFHADRRTDMTKLLVAFRSSANASKKGKMAEIEANALN